MTISKTSRVCVTLGLRGDGVAVRHIIADKVRCSVLKCR